MSVVDKHVPLNRQAAQQSVVLIKNTGNFLPVDFSRFTSVAIIGPCADDPDCSRGKYSLVMIMTRPLLMILFIKVIMIQVQSILLLSNKLSTHLPN